MRRLIVLRKDGTPLLAERLGNIKVRSLEWAGDNAVLLEASNTAALGLGFTAAKAELHSMTVLPLSGAEPWVIFDKNTVITGGIQGYYGLTERQGTWYGYFGGITLESDGKTAPYLKSARPVLYEVNLESRKNKKLAPRVSNELDRRQWLVGPDGQVSATLDYISDMGRWSIKNGTGQTIASGINKLGGIDLVGFGRTAGSLIYSVDDTNSGDAHWFELPVSGGAATPFLEEQDVGSSLFDRRSRQIIGYSVSADTPSYRFFDAFRDKVMAATIKAFPNLSVHLIDWNDKFDRLVVMTEGMGDPQTWWIVDIKTGAATELGVSYPMPAQDVAPMRMIHYKAADGLDIAAVLTLPPGKPAKNLPVVVLPHGGPGARDYPVFHWWAQAFASRGYAVLQPNFRGSTGYGAAFERAGFGEWGKKMQTDLSDGLAQLVKDGLVDPKRACIMGASYGGYAALAGVTLQHGIYRCAVSVAGISDIQKMAITEFRESGGNQTMRRNLQAELGSGRDLGAVSPIRFAAAADAPVLLMHGKSDTVVDYDQSNDMAIALRKAGKTVEFVPLPGEDHWLSLSATRLAMLETAVAFVEKYNPSDLEK